MANNDHVKRLGEGANRWNQWRSQNENVKPDLSSARLSLMDLSGANLSRANLSRADLSRANVANANLRYAILKHSDMLKANLSSADLYYANLSNANLSGATLSKASLTSATLFGANFMYARIAGTDFENAKTGATIFAEVDFSQAINLENVRHQGPSIIGIDTLYRSSGRIPEVFLRGCGAPDTFIAFVQSLVNTDFYSCFISFTEADDAISERLHNDLQAAGVRCWRWKEDARWGKTLMRSIDEAVRVYDKLVVICSKQSLNAPAVIREIERALQKEDDLARQGKDSDVLFPVRIDDYIFAGWDHYRKADVLAKNVGDFRNWHDPAIYRDKLSRLLRDLKAERKSK